MHYLQNGVLCLHVYEDEEKPETDNYILAKKRESKYSSLQKKGIKYTSIPGKSSVQCSIKYNGKLVNMSWI